MSKSIAIFIPTYSEAQTLPTVLDRIPQTPKEHAGDVKWKTMITPFQEDAHGETLE